MRGRAAVRVLHGAAPVRGRQRAAAAGSLTYFPAPGRAGIPSAGNLGRFPGWRAAPGRPAPGHAAHTARPARHMGKFREFQPLENAAKFKEISGAEILWFGTMWAGARGSRSAVPFTMAAVTICWLKLDPSTLCENIILAMQGNRPETRVVLAVQCQDCIQCIHCSLAPTLHSSAMLGAFLDTVSPGSTLSNTLLCAGGRAAAGQRGGGGGHPRPAE